MRLLFIVCIWLLAQSNATTYNCKDHSHTLTLKTHGYEHINHQLYLDKTTLIKELSDAMWFTDDVQCTSKGFNIIVSHQQYNDFTQKKFLLLPNENNSTYILQESK